MLVLEGRSPFALSVQCCRVSTVTRYILSTFWFHYSGNPVWEESEDAPWRSTGRRPRLGGALARALAQLGVSLSNGVLQLLQQELQEDGETLGLPLSQILQGDLAAIEGINHGDGGHTALLRAGGLAPRPGRGC